MLGRDSQTDRGSQRPRDQVGDGEGEDGGRQHPEALAGELGEAATEQQTLVRDRRVDGHGGDEADEQRADDAAHVVHRDDVERVVVLEPVLQPAGEQSGGAGRGETTPAAGVIATRPATAPEAAPRVVALPVARFSSTSQPIMPPTPDRWVASAALAARCPALSADPALNPIQPNHSRAAPSRVSGRLCGAMISRGQPRRGPNTSARARADAPEQISTTCLLYTSDAADDLLCVDLGGRRIIKKKKKK